MDGAMASLEEADRETALYALAARLQFKVTARPPRRLTRDQTCVPRPAYPNLRTIDRARESTAKCGPSWGKQRVFS
jgi:hypothetical protein